MSPLTVFSSQHSKHLQYSLWQHGACCKGFSRSIEAVGLFQIVFLLKFYVKHMEGNHLFHLFQSVLADTEIPLKSDYWLRLNPLSLTFCGFVYILKFACECVWMYMHGCTCALFFMRSEDNVWHWLLFPPSEFQESNPGGRACLKWPHPLSHCAGLIVSFSHRPFSPCAENGLFGFPTLPSCS